MATGSQPEIESNAASRGDATARLAAAGIHVGAGFLPPFALARLLGALDALAPAWRPSEELGLLGRGGTTQVRAPDIATQTRLDEVREILAPAALRWARACGFAFPPGGPHLVLFPVRMLGSEDAPAFQEPHLDSTASRSGPPLCTNVFYARTKGVVGGELAVAMPGSEDLADHAMVTPSANTMVTIAGDRVHWVRPLYKGERLSVVINFFR